MERLKVKLENCFGISKLEHEFDFTSRNVNSIYAPNGTMKTSFTKTFKCIKEKNMPMDLVNPQKVSICSIIKDTGEQITNNDLLVIESYREEFKVDKISTLLASEKLKKEYDSIYANLEVKQDKILSEIIKVCGIRKKNEVLQELVESWDKKENEFYQCVKEVIENKDTYKIPFRIKYRDIINDKVEEFISKNENMALLNEYIEKYDELISKSKYFEKGVFTHNNIEDISKNLNGNGFFKVKKIKNSIFINDKKIENKKQLEELLKDEKNKILNDDELLSRFNKIDLALNKNAKLNSFRTIIENNPEIITYLKNIKDFKKVIWGSYLLDIEDETIEFIKEYEKSKDEIKKILEDAKNEHTLWNDVIEIYNERFDVPFVIEIKNKEDVILQSNTPIINFKYKVRDSNKDINNETLLEILSNGEKRALYILNVIFEIESLKKLRNNTLIIIDDIADSFDYKNKYAIIEYLNDILKEDIFKMIILTHNFDFYRTIKNRLNIYRENCLIAQKDDNEIKIVKGDYFGNIFNIWKNNLCNDRILIASIPFVRNLSEYLEEKESSNYKKLTSLLHIKEETETLTVQDLENIYQSIWKTEKNLKDKDRIIKDIIYCEANKILNETTEKINLENKIVLSIAIRLLAEEYMIENIRDKGKIIKINKNQTTKLFSILKDENLIDKKAKIILEQVNIMTPENIHINSFMYEPILDLSDNHLKKLYCDVKNL
ncbi:hypothetical protein ACV3RG_10550 [Clostridium perfringens]